MLGLRLDWCLLEKRTLKVGAALVPRMAEAADLGYFARSDTPLSIFAAELVNGVMPAQCAPFHSARRCHPSGAYAIVGSASTYSAVHMSVASCAPSLTVCTFWLTHCTLV